ncbi:ABC transporter ATP-binding protein [candidate division KSB1 bacterium]|nr:ABC transporter ATP-binding protein [candidate division KSB1 bacterium]
MKEPIIQIRDLVTYYGSRKILDGISLDIFPGETIVILGRSGCGKSTLLRHIIGLSRPTSGQIIIKGQDITSKQEDELIHILKRIGMLFQSAALFNSMTIGQNVALPLKEHTQLEDSTIRIMTRMKLEQVGLSGFEDFMPSQLSGGMRKRAGLARAIAMDPEILFCDEPSAGLDPVVAIGIDQLLINLKKAFKMTLVVVTHELESVKLIADRVAMLHDGKLIACDTLDNVMHSDDIQIQNFFNRVPETEFKDPDLYLKSLFE